jgi:hypothetical protein
MKAAPILESRTRLTQLEILPASAVGVSNSEGRIAALSANKGILTKIIFAPMAPSIIRAEEPMMTNPPPAIKTEVSQLVDRQIETLRQPASLTSADLLEYRVRSQKITGLYRELDRIVRTSFGESQRAS